MVTTIKVLKRRDASSVVVAIVIGWIVAQMLPALTAKLAGDVSGVSDGQYIAYAVPGADWQAQYLYPVVHALLQLVLLEIVLWVWTALVAAFKR